MNPIIQEAIDSKFLECKDDPNAAASFMVDISLLTMAQAYNEVMNKLNSTQVDDDHHVKSEYAQEYVNDSIMRAHEIWKEVMNYMNHKYNVNLEESFFLVTLSNYANPDNLPISKIPDIPMKMICKGIIHTLKVLGTDIFHVGTTDYNQMLIKENKKMNYAMDHTDPDMLKSFFILFKELGSFHRDINTYESEDDKKKYRELMDIYNHMLSVLE